MLYAIVALLVIIADQWLKYWVALTIPLESTGVEVFPGLLSLVNLHNDGCALSLFSGGGARIYFIILTGVFTVAVIIALATRFISGPVSRWSILLVTAGGISNCIDRIIYGYVQDMFKLELFNFPIFNIADIFITICCIIFVIAIIFEKDKKDELNEFVDVDEEEDTPRRKRRKKAAEPEEEVPQQPVLAEKPAKPRKKPVDNYEQFKAQRAARQQAPAAPSANPRPARVPADSADPFAEWEKANAKVEARQANSYAAKATGVKPEYQSPKARYSAPQPQRRQPQKQSRPVRNPQPARPAQPVQNPQRRPAPQFNPERAAQNVSRPVDFEDFIPAAPADPFASAPETVQQPVHKTAAEPKVEDISADFSLDDILNEFK